MPDRSEGGLDEPKMGQRVLLLAGEGRGHGELDAPAADAHQGPDLEQAEPDRAAGGGGELGVLETDSAQGAEQNIGHGGEPEAELVGPHGGGRGPVSKEVELAFLDAVLELAAGAVDILVEPAGVARSRAQRGDDEARVGAAVRPLGFGDDPASAAPAVVRRPPELLEAARRLVCGTARGFDGRQLLDDLRLEPCVTSQAEDIVDAVTLAPAHQRLAGKAAVGTQHDLHPAPPGPDLPDDTLDLLDRPGRGIDVRAPELGREQMPAAEDVERQVAPAVVVSMVEASTPI